MVLACVLRRTIIYCELRDLYVHEVVSYLPGIILKLGSYIDGRQFQYEENFISISRSCKNIFMVRYFAGRKQQDINRASNTRHAHSLTACYFDPAHDEAEIL